MFDEKTIAIFYELVGDVFKDTFKSKELEFVELDVYDGNDGFNDENESYCIDITCDEKIVPWQFGEFYCKLFFLDNKEVDISIVIPGYCANVVAVNQIIRQHENTPLNDIWGIDCNDEGDYPCMLSTVSYETYGDLYNNIKKALIKLFDPNLVATLKEICTYLEED